MNGASGCSHYAAAVDMPFGRLEVRLQDEAVAAIDRLERQVIPLRNPSTPAARRLVDELKDPGAGFATALAPRRTPFQRAVWHALGAISRLRGTGRRVGSAPRAVRQACRRKAIPVVVPCYRVVGVGGAGGYAGETAGADPGVKLWLLRHEGAAI
ncbi:MAG: MGMT family protein [Gammaproteobacteria bacterium]